MAEKNSSFHEYVPARKMAKTDESSTSTEDENLLWTWSENPERMTEIEKINNQLLLEHPEEYEALRSEELTSICAQLETALEQERQVLSRRLNESMEKQFETQKREIESDLEQSMEDEIKKSVDRELKNAERRKDFECKRAYAKIKSEMIKAKVEGNKICLQCGNPDAGYPCECRDAFYCNKDCHNKHKWIHTTYCDRSKSK